MPPDSPHPGPLFHGVKYHICPCLHGLEQLRKILDSHGAQEASELKLATRVITDETHFFHFEEPRCKAVLVTPQWVYSSVKAGIKQPAQYYSADPAMFFSSAVVSVIGFSPAYEDLVRTVVTKYGGQWAATLTEDVTHLIADTAHSTPPAHLHPIIDTSPYENAAAQQKVRRAPMERQPLPFPFIPFEIIAKIFLMCRNLALDKLSGYVEVLLNLSQVSQRWRTIAHNTGPLWTHIFLDFHTTKSYNRRLKLAENVWIARSGSHPLSVNIRSYYPSSPNPAIAFLVAHKSRIRDLTLHLPATHFHAFFQIAARSFPVLETVTLSVIPKSNTVFYPDLGMTRSEFFAEDFPAQNQISACFGAT
ncbi:hypothetical protein DFH09DRAFT_1302932 [Mycena vulgaris]|nr:hypothetical protein DFH09DRAFT_1302932 [Mycena vulgaris]